MAFRDYNPFDFRLLNDKNEEVFYLEDKMEGVTLEITNHYATPIIVQQPGNYIPGKDNYHFALKFRPDTLGNSQGEYKDGDWMITPSLPDVATGCTTIYLTYYGSSPIFCESEGIISVKLNLDISGTKGTRTTNVEMLSGNTILKTDGSSLINSTRQINWTLINHRGKPNLPLQICFKDSDTVLNDGIANNLLNLRIYNTQKYTPENSGIIEFNNDPSKGPVSRILLFFDSVVNNSASATSLSDLGHLSKIIIGQVPGPTTPPCFTVDAPSDQNFPVWIAQLNMGRPNFKLLPLINNVTSDNDSKTKFMSRMVSPRAMGIKETFVTPLKSMTVFSQSPEDYATYLDFSLSNIITNYSTGVTHLHICFENIPGYWDQTFILEIQKQPVIMRGNRVGIFTNNPQSELDVNGDMKVRGPANIEGLLLVGTSQKSADLNVIGNIGCNGYISANSQTFLFNNGTPVLKHDDVSAYLYPQGTGTRDNVVVIGGNTSLGVTGNTSLWQNLRVGGNVGIGTPNPIATLDVNGDIHASGTLRGDSANILYSGGFSDNSWNVVLRKDGANAYIYPWGTGTGSNNVIVGGGVGTNFTVSGNTSLQSNLDVAGYAHIGGRVGIGTNSPGYPLEVKGGVNAHMVEGFWFLMNGDCRASRGTYDNTVSIKVDWSVYSQAYYCYSDERIKENVILADSPSDLMKLNNLLVKDYQHKDFVVQGSKVNRGFIAQEVEKVFPEAVSRNKDFIPDIYALPEKTTLEANVLTVKMKTAHQLVTGDLVRVITETNASHEVIVTVTDELNFVIQDWTESSEHLFIYGKQVEDFRVLNYDHIFCTGISAIQELSKQVTGLQDQLQKQEERLSRLESLLKVPSMN